MPETWLEEVQISPRENKVSIALLACYKVVLAMLNRHDLMLGWYSRVPKTPGIIPIPHVNPALALYVLGRLYWHSQHLNPQSSNIRWLLSWALIGHRMPMVSWVKIIICYKTSCTKDLLVTTILSGGLTFIDGCTSNGTLIGHLLGVLQWER